MRNKYDHFIWFNPNIDTTSTAINDVVSRLKAEIIASYKISRWSSRFSDHIKIIVLNLNNTAFIDRTRYVGYSRNKGTYTKSRKSRYVTFKMAYDSMVNMVDALMDLKYIEGVNGYNFKQIKYSRTAKMKATDKLIELCLEHNINPYDFISTSDEEVIILKTKDIHTKRKYSIEYEDTSDTVAMRNNLDLINQQIQEHFIGLNVCEETLAEIKKAIVGIKVEDCAAYDDYDEYEDQEEDEGSRSWNSGKKNSQPYLDLSKNKLKRIFNNGSFEQGGRFYGGWWQAIPSRFRPYIAIDDHQTIEVDYSGIHINLLYLQENLPLSLDDVYTIEGFPTESRKVLKVALQILLNSQNETRALRSIRNKFPAKDYPELFTQVSHEQIIDAFKEKHVGIQKYFYKGAGVKLQFIDSQIAEDILLALASQGIAVLPIHDSFIVRKDAVEILKDSMKEAVRRRFGQVLKLKVDKTAYDLDIDILARAMSLEDIPSSEEEYEREWLSKHRDEYLSRRDHWYSGRNN